MNTRALLIKLAKRFPKWIAKKNHDHVGLMAGKLKSETNKILLCLDFDEEVLPIAKKEKPDLIISHHPFIFGTKGYVLKHDERKRKLFDGITSLNIPVYSMHTNFDEGRGGMNDALAEALGLKDIYAPEKDPMMRCGTLENPLPVEEFAKFATKSLKSGYGLLVHAGKKIIKSAAIVGGGGSRGWSIAKDEGVDIYISGDAPHHVRRDIIAAKYNYLDLPHEIEKIFMPTMKKILLECDKNLDIIVVDHEKVPEVI
jgi:dinuclear metal center YbgI/SA1388 family protein